MPPDRAKTMRRRANPDASRVERRETFGARFSFLSPRGRSGERIACLPRGDHLVPRFINTTGCLARTLQWGLGSARVSRALVGVPPTSRGGNFQHRLVLSQEPPRPSAGRRHVFSVVGTSRCDVRAACSGATPSIARVALRFVPPATTRAGTARRAIPTIGLNRYDAEGGERDGRGPLSQS